MKISRFIVLLSILTSAGLYCEEGPMVMQAVELELLRSEKELKLADYQLPYFISYLITDSDYYRVSAENGAISFSEDGKFRYAYPEIRVGSYHFDNTRFGKTSYGGTPIPSEENIFAIRHALWRITDEKYKESAAEFLQKKADLSSEMDTDKDLDDFTKETKVTYYDRTSDYKFDRNLWESEVRELSAEFRKYSYIIETGVDFWYQPRTLYYANTEGTRIIEKRSKCGLYLRAETLTDEGVEIQMNRAFYADTPAGLPEKKVINNEIETIAGQIKELISAKEGEPCVAPAIFDPESSATLFHEAIGHRLEGERQREQEEGQTFKNKIGEKICPDFLTVIDDPTMNDYKGAYINGHYKFDEEGVPAQRVVLVKDGILKNFLLSRRPVTGYFN